MELIKPQNVRGFQTDLKTGLYVPGTYFEDHNTIQNDFRYYLAYKIGTNTTDQALNNLWTSDGALGSGDSGYDGIAHGAAGTALDYKFATSLNAGGDNSLTYIEYYGYIDGAVTLSGNLYLGFTYVHGGTTFTKLYSTYDINTSVAASRRYHFYWKITAA